MNWTRRQWGSIVLLIGCISAIPIFFVDWYRYPYVRDATVGQVQLGTYPVKLIDILLHTIRIPPGATSPVFGPTIFWQIGLYFGGILFFVVTAIIALRTKAPLRGLFILSCVYIVIIGGLTGFEQLGAGLTALSAPYVGIQLTSYHLLLLVYSGCIFVGSYLISLARKNDATT